MQLNGNVFISDVKIDTSSNLNQLSVIKKLNLIKNQKCI